MPYIDVYFACIKHRLSAIDAVVQEEVLEVSICDAWPGENVCVDGIDKIGLVVLSDIV